MKYIRLLLVLLTVSAPIQAAPRWLTAVPRDVGRTYKNMFTFKSPVLAIGQWAGFAVLAFDEKTTVDSFQRCAQCRETGLLYHGKRYGTGLAILGTVTGGTWYASWEEISDENLRSDPNKYWRNAGKTIFLLPVAFHTYYAVGNMAIQADKPMVRGTWKLE